MRREKVNVYRSVESVDGGKSWANYSNDLPVSDSRKVSLLNTDQLAGANNFIASDVLYLGRAK